MLGFSYPIAVENCVRTCQKKYAMANELDELTGNVNQEGRDVNVIEKQLPVKIGVGSLIFEIFPTIPPMV
mgnify:FL=1